MVIVQSALPTTNLLTIVTRMMIQVEPEMEMNLIQMQIQAYKRKGGESLFFVLPQFLKFSN